MPTVLLNGPYRFYFYSSDGDEPLHIHVQRDQAVAKFWLNPIRYEYSAGFRPVEIRRIQGIIEAQSKTFTEAWNEYFSE
jgi:hypothetical protein